MKIFENSKRPLLLYGAGIHLSGAEYEAIALAHKLGVPVVCTWGACDLFHFDDPLYVGTFGTHGTRAPNWAIQNADVILSVGSRLDTKATGAPVSGFAPKATVHMIDIDRAEVDKFARLGREIIGYVCDAKQALQNALATTEPVVCSEWLARIADWKQRYPACMPEYGEDNPYRFVDRLSDLLSPDDIIVSDTGCPVGWMAQGFRFKGQRFIHAWNNTPMGYGLPAAIGAAFAAPNKRIICITGDGGLGVNVTEMATLARHKCNVKIILFNNGGHAMCRQTQRTWMGGTYPSTSYEGGLATPDFVSVASAYDIPVHWSIEDLLLSEGMGFFEYVVGIDEQLVPQVRADQPLENASPFIPADELARIMGRLPYVLTNPTPEMLASCDVWDGKS